jgi:hypothetical protein
VYPGIFGCRRRGEPRDPWDDTSRFADVTSYSTTHAHYMYANVPDVRLLYMNRDTATVVTRYPACSECTAHPILLI